MAISYITGIPKSGKTYLAVYKIWENFIQEPKKSLFKKSIKSKYNICYTNINGFKFEKSDKVKKLDLNEFKYCLSELYSLYKIGADDELLNKKASEFQINYCLIVIDEAHNFFTKKGDEVLTWWLTYHAHIFQDIWLITQDLSLIDKGYKSIAEFFYKSVEPSRRLIASRLRYQQFSSHNMYQVDLIKGGGFTLPALPEVFDLYIAGEKTKGSSVVVKFLILAGFLFLLVFFGFNKFLDSFAPEKKPIDKNLTSKADNNLSHYSYNISPKFIDINATPTLFLYDIYCVLDRCSIKGDYLDLNYGYFHYILNKHPPDFIDIDNKLNNVTRFYLGFKAPVFDNLKKDRENEKNNIPTVFGGSLFP